MNAKELIVEIAGQIVAAKPDLVTIDEVRFYAERAETLEDAKRFLWGLRCRAAVIRLGTKERFALEDALEASRRLIRTQGGSK